LRTIFPHAIAVIKHHDGSDRGIEKNFKNGCKSFPFIYPKESNMSKRSILRGMVGFVSALGLTGSLALAVSFLSSQQVQAIPVCDGPNPPPVCDPRPHPTPTPTPQPEPPGTNVTVPATLIATIVNNATQGSQLHLNNLGPKHGSSWHKPNDSYIRLSQTLGGAEYRFNLPEKTIDLDCGILCPDLGTGHLYVQDWNLSRTEVAWQSPQFKLSLFFESNGREIKGFHTGAVSLGDNGLPDAQIDNARLDVYVKPVVSNGRLTYLVTSTNFSADIQATGVCNVGVDVCDRIFKYKNELVTQVESQVRTRLNDPALRDRVAAAIQPTLNQFGIGSVTKVSVNGDNLIIRHTGK
jgi:hypothetical protein